MPTVNVATEQNRPGGWSYLVRVTHDDGSDTDHTVRLSWADHDYWCGGASPPSRVVQAVIEYLLRHRPTPLPAAFDAGKARRWLPQIDEELRGVM